MRFLLGLNSSSTRRLNSILKLDSSVLMLCTKNEVHFLVDNNIFWKGLTLPASVEEESFIKIDSNLLTYTLSGEGLLVIDIDGTEITLAFAKTLEKVKESEFNTIAKGEVELLSRSVVFDYLNMIKKSNTPEFSFDGLDNLKNLISACKITENGMQIVDGFAMTRDSNITLYYPMLNPNLKLGLTTTALDEIDKFKTNCESLTVKNYLILKRDGFTLGVPKANVQGNLDSFVPEEYRSDEFCQEVWEIDLNPLSQILANYNKKETRNLESIPSVRINLNNSNMIVTLGRKQIIVRTYCKKLKENISSKNKSLELTLETLVRLQKLLNSKDQINQNVIVSIYKYNARIKFKDGSYAIIRGDFIE